MLQQNVVLVKTVNSVCCLPKLVYAVFLRKLKVIVSKYLGKIFGFKFVRRLMTALLRQTGISHLFSLLPLYQENKGL